MIKNIVFDLGNVIAKFDPYAIYYQFTSNEEEAMELYQLLIEKGLWWNLDQGMELDDVVDLVKGQSPSHFHVAIEKIIHTWIDVLEIDPKIDELIHSLKTSGYNIYLLSNISKQFYDFKEKNTLFDVFDGLYISADSKLVKPDIEIYEDFLSKFDLNANESLFIDDRLENIHGANQAQIHTFHYQDNIDELISTMKNDYQISVEIK